MTTIYISSTYEDLKDHRRAVADALRNIGYDVDAMEKYPAREDRPRAECEKDAARCDVYVGVIAWRYGYVPPEDNPQGLSITQLEYLAAGLASRPRLMFLANEADWPPQFRDSTQGEETGEAIASFRHLIGSEKWFATFQSRDDLTTKVMISLVQLGSMKRAESLAALDTINRAAELGPSYLGNIQQQIGAFVSTEFVCVRLGPTPWWDTRLHLVAALASDFTDVKQFILLDPQGKFVTMASPVELRRALSKSRPAFEGFYQKARELARNAQIGEVEGIVNFYPSSFHSQPEVEIKQVLNPVSVRELGIRADGEAVEKDPQQREAVFYSSLVQRSKPFVAVMESGNLQGIVDRTELASGIAGIYLR